MSALLLATILNLTPQSTPVFIGTRMSGLHCTVTNNEHEAIEITQIIFRYVCTDGMVQKAPMRIDNERLEPSEKSSYRFPGPGAGCFNPHVINCSVKAVFIN